jgi:small GTP-binding protein
LYRSIAFDGQVVKLQIWDTSGQERFRSITSSYYRGASGVLLVYANDCQASYAALAGWLNEARRSCAENTPVMIVCAKNDLPAKTDHNEARAWAESQGCLFAVTSAKNNDGVFDAFSAIAQTATGLAGIYSFVCLFVFVLIGCCFCKETLL